MVALVELLRTMGRWRNTIDARSLPRALSRYSDSLFVSDVAAKPVYSRILAAGDRDRLLQVNDRAVISVGYVDGDGEPAGGIKVDLAGVAADTPNIGANILPPPSTQNIAAAGSASANTWSTVSTQGVNTEAFGAARLFWRANGVDGGGGAPVAPTTMDISVWALNGPLGWVRIATIAALGPGIEVRVPEVGYRRIFFEITAAAGAGPEEAILFVGGEV